MSIGATRVLGGCVAAVTGLAGGYLTPAAPGVRVVREGTVSLAGKER